MSSSRSERFSPIAQRVLRNAEQEARAFQQDAIYPHHLFLALLMETEGVANRVLRSYQLNYERVRPLVNLIVSGSYRGSYSPMPDLTPQIKRALEQSVDVARRLGHSYIGSEHLLLGLLDSLDDVMEETLRRLKIPPALLRDRTYEILKSHSEAPAEGDAPPVLVTPQAAPRRMRLRVTNRHTGETSAEFVLAPEQVEQLRKLLAEGSGTVTWESGDDEISATVE